MGIIPKAFFLLMDAAVPITNMSARKPINAALINCLFLNFFLVFKIIVVLIGDWFLTVLYMKSSGFYALTFRIYTNLKFIKFIFV